MRTSHRFSTIALLTTAFTVMPAYAASLNIGGAGPLIDLGNSNTADATVSVNIGNRSGGGDTLGALVDSDGDGGLINLGGSHDVVDLGGEGDSVIDLGGNGALLDLGDGADLLDLGGAGLIDLAAIGSGDDPLLDLTGEGVLDGFVDVDPGGVDLLDLGTTGSILDVDGNGDLIDLGSNSELLDLGDGGFDFGNEDLLDLGGSSTELVAIDLGHTQVGADVSIDNGTDPLVDVDISTDGDGLAGTGLLPNTDGNATVGGANAASVTITSNGGGGTGAGGDRDPTGGNGQAGGSNGNSGGNGSGAGTGGGSAAGNGSSGNGMVAGVSGRDKCLTLDAQQLEQLIGRHTYDRATFNSWASARALKIVPVDFCDAEVAKIAAAADGSANVARLQAFLAAQAKVKAGLQSKGYSAGDVIAADHSGAVLIVYVI